MVPTAGSLVLNVYRSRPGCCAGLRSRSGPAVFLLKPDVFFEDLVGGLRVDEEGCGSEGVDLRDW